MGAISNRLVFGEVKVRVFGLNTQVFLQKMQAKKVVFKNLFKTEDGFVFSVSFMDFKKVKNYCKKTNLKFEILGEISAKSLLISLLKRSGVLLGLMVWLVFALYFQNSVFEVKVEAMGAGFGVNESVIFSKTQQLLSSEIDNGVTNLRELERKVISNFEEVSTCTIEKKGIYYFATLSPIVKPQNTDEIVCPFYGKIREVTVASGEACVKAGDVVTAGQVLATATTNSAGQKEPANAKFKIDAWVIGTSIFSENVKEVKRTGRTQESRAVKIFGMQVGKFSECSFSLFEEEISEEYVSFNNLLPVKVVTKKYYEMGLGDKSLNFEEEKERLYQKALEAGKEQLPKGVHEFEPSYIVTQEGTSYKIDCYIKFSYEI